jgi:hypothetical protein
MKTWLALLLTVGTFMVGCAAGDYARRSDYVERPADTRVWHQNTESDAERANRIWGMESRP